MLLSTNKNRPRLPKCDFAMTGLGCANCGCDGFVEGTTVLAEHGWRDVAGLVQGDLVQTVEHELQPITHIESHNIWRQPGTCPVSVCPLWVPAGAIGNETDFLLQAETLVGIASRAYEKETGHIYALLTGADLEGFNGIELYQPDTPTRVFQLHFEHEELVGIADGAVGVCPSMLSGLNVSPTAGEETIHASSAGYPKLDKQDARYFLDLVRLKLKLQLQPPQAG